MKVFVTGISGGLGREFVPYGVEGCWGSRPVQGFPQVDLTDRQATEAVLRRSRPDVVIHTVGWVDVDGCERDPSRALAVNVGTLLHLRKYSEPLGFRIVFISTNDVFSGDQGQYREEARPDPVNVYAQTKAAAETLLRPGDLIVRASLLSWNCNGKVSFVRWLIDSLDREDTPSLFVDQFTSPVTTRTLARLLMEGLLEQTGILHFATERRSRFEIGRVLARGLDRDPEKIRQGSLNDHGFVARRPRDVSLNSDRLTKILGKPLTLEEEVAVLGDDRPKSSSGRRNKQSSRSISP